MEVQHSKYVIERMKVLYEYENKSTFVSHSRFLSHSWLLSSLSHYQKWKDKWETN
jgi:hypothetical protein